MLGARVLLLALLTAPPADDGAAPFTGERAGATSAGVAPPASPAPSAGVTRPGGVTAAAAIAARWNAQRQPAPGPARALGGYSAGCLQGASPLPLRGPGFEVLRPSRHRYYGHPSLVAFIHRLAATTARHSAGPLLVGDMSQPRGGPTPTGHKSHQSGLDVDLGYGPAAAARRRLTPGLRETLVPPVVVDLETRTLTARWQPRMMELLAAAASDPAVDRLFVHPVVKRELCTKVKRPAPWLARVRPWWGHHDHFHVRLKCPADEPGCEAQPALSETDDGCGATLAWWWSDDARATREKKQQETETSPGPLLPPACEALLATP